MKPHPSLVSIHSALFLLLSFVAMAGLFVLARAEFLAAVQILVYAGAILVLFLFVVMLLSLSDAELGFDRVTAVKWVGIAGGLGVFGLLIRAISEVPVQAMRPVAADYGTVKAVGKLLFTQYLLPFEATSVLLLVAIVGAVVVAKQRI